MANDPGEDSWNFPTEGNSCIWPPAPPRIMKLPIFAAAIALCMFSTVAKSADSSAGDKLFNADLGNE
jgi:hypothetical protein